MINLERHDIMAPRVRLRTPGLSKNFLWAHWPDDKLLRLRLSDLALTIEGSWVHSAIRALQNELARANLGFDLHFWISDEWFCPDGIAGVAVPFYLFHPRLARLEHYYIGEAEGYSLTWCMRLLRHETGHAIDNAFGLRRQPARQRVFGPSARTYPNSYVPRLHSRDYVRNLGKAYAQAHPDEDFAETFAVWLDPLSQWRLKYRDWPALKKLLLMDRMMREISDKQPKLTNCRRSSPIEQQKVTLKEYFAEKRQRLRLRGYPGRPSGNHRIYL